MKSILVLSLIAQCCGTSADQARELATLAQKWNLSEPAFNYTSLGFDLDFTVSDFILDTMISHEIYDINCKEGGVTVPSTTMASALVPDNTPAGVGDFTRSVEVDLTINSETIADSIIYSETTDGGQVVGQVRFCHRFMLQTSGDSPIVVNFLETIVTLTIDLTDGFSIDTLNVNPKDKLLKTANEVYQVVGYQCNAQNVPLNDFQLQLSRNQGSIVRVCVRPDDRATGDGIYMRAIESFVFDRDYGGAIGKITQIAIENRETAQNQLTVLFCNAGDAVCSFESILMAVFYRFSGAVQGYGVASMQFGSQTSRQLRSRAAQEDLVAAVAEFELDMELLPRPDHALTGTSAGSSLSFLLASALSVCVCLLGML